MRAADRELLSRVSRVNAAAGTLVIQVLSGITDDDALAADFATIGHLYSQLGAAFTARATEIGHPPGTEVTR